ncbi:ribonuclease III [Moraxella macacae 0408225]|uniref:Ribonuclease 3 n=1 Tax=Moraxella macacae 0408225 TaxID=1230338 RepID=L2F9J1_9GAMM|nr:ribonuclease III [Moraxella macacae]ELA09707.1 ribonuclease III [Moraxella macacae 0408225]
MIATIPTFDVKKLPSQVRKLSALSYEMGYHFSNPNLPILALMHRSFDPLVNYERLEFLGDALLGVVIAEALYERYPNHNEGRLTRMRATLVRESSLAMIANELKLFDYLILGVGERKGGGRHRISILADAVEALIGAIYLDSGDFITVKQCILTWYEKYALFGLIQEQQILKDAKSRLQELLQAHQLPLPKYELLETIGNAPNQIFRVQCSVVGFIHANQTEQITTATGESRRIAEQRCAETMIQIITDKLAVLK